MEFDQTCLSMRNVKDERAAAKILQQFGAYSFLSPSYIRNQYVYNGNQTGYDRAESPTEDRLTPKSTLNISPASSGYGSFDETPDKSINVNDSSGAAEDLNRRSPYDYTSVTCRTNETDSYVKERNQENKDSEHNTSPVRLSPSSPDNSPIEQESSASRSTNSSPGSTKSSPSPTSSRTSGTESKPLKKNARTAYTNEQIQTLLKIFHENPYPDSEHMERIAMDFGVAENKIKIWFQNKRARWRRRVNSNTAAYPQQFIPMIPPMNQYGYLPYGQFMTSSPYMMPGCVNYATMQTPISTDIQSGSGNSRLQPIYPTSTPVPHFPSITPHHQLTSSLPYSRTSPPHHLSTLSNYPGLLSHYSSAS